MIFGARVFLAVALAVLAASELQAADIFWEGGTGDLLDANYSDGTNTGLSPAPGDVVHFGNDGAATFSDTAALGKLRVGHNEAVGGGGDGTVTVENFGFLELTAGAAGAANAALWVGAGQDGTLNIDSAIVTVNQLAVVGYGDDANTSGTLHITNGGSLFINAGNLMAGQRTSGPGAQGHVMIEGSSSILSVGGGGADLLVGIWSAQSSYTQLGGTVTINDDIIVGQRNSDNSTFSVSGGSLTTGGGGQLLVSNGTAAQDHSDNVAVSFTGNAVVELGGNVTLGDADARNTSWLIADNAQVSTVNTGPAGNVFIGRGNSSDTTFTMTGGALNVGNHFLMGTAVGATGIVANHSGGTITTVANFAISDTNGQSTYHLSDSGQVNVGGLMIVGRRNGAVMNQTGGSVTSTLGVHVGNAQSGNAEVFGNGTYNVSGGTITANQSEGTALSIAPAGTGTFRVIGDDATINVNGDMLVNADADSQGTLAFQLEDGDLLSMINVTGSATFNAGAILTLDDINAAPSQTSYDLLTAASIVDSGISFSGPAGWGYQIVAGGNGQVLQVMEGLAPVLSGDHNGDGVVDAADYVVWRKTNVDGQQGYDDWRANFGATSPGAGAIASAQVPEPAAWLLVAIGLTVIRMGVCPALRHRGGP